MASSIPLSCNICPKRPTFSDVSHLLTHIASKGHLSHYYKIKVRAGSDSDARCIIDSYDQWYTEWDVEALMSERMSLKDKKRPRPKATAASRASSSNTSAATARQRAAISRQTSTARTTPSYRQSPALSAFDPRLVDHHVKHEIRDTPPLQSLNIPTLHAPRPFGPGPSFDFNTRGSLAPTTYYIGRHHSPHATPPQYETTTFSYGDPTRQNAYVDPITVHSTSPVKSEGGPQYSNDEDDLPQPTKPVPDTAKLKGVLWPGMSIFDSATPIARRRRNQKKDASILEQLEANSLDVHPTEFVWTPNGRLRKQKEISGLPSSSSPVKSPVKPVQRTPLAEIEHRHPWNVQLGGPRYSSYADQKLEESLTYGGLLDAVDKRKKRPLQIWQDEDCEVQPSTFGHPAQFTYLTRGFQAQGDRSEENKTGEGRRRTRSSFRGSDVESKPRENESERRVPKEARTNFMTSHHYGVPSNGLSSLLAAAEDAHAHRSMTTDPFSVHHHHHHPGLGTAYESPGLFSTTSHQAIHQPTLASRRHGHSLSIEALLIGGCPTTSGMHAENGSGPVFSHSHVGYGSGNPYGFGGFRIASPSRPSADWNNFWHSVHSAGTGNGFWGYTTDDPHHAHGEEDGISRGYGDDDAASVGDRPGESKISLADVPENRDAHKSRNNHTNQKITTSKQHDSEDTGSVPEIDTEMDEDRTVSAPPSPRK